MPDADTPGRLWFTGCAPHRGGSSQPWVGWAREDAPYRSPTMPPTQPAPPPRPRRPKRQHPVLLLIDDLHVRVIDRHAGRHPPPATGRGDGHRFVAQLQPPKSELWSGDGIVPDPRSLPSRLEQAAETRGEVDHPEQL